ncbi:DUF262 domain-containing HNH endonuclease family protein [Paenisporosarcina sp. FSL H8-0542]|uniref:DUF262 domain-containing protein n=1 Tax=Paenisporosarcina sp. FSL H8-0542 TaxID=2921401 RepID=UPI00315ABC86
MDKTTLEARGLTLEKYLNISYGLMQIPFTQRPYEWGKVQISRLFYDFCNVYENKADQHILNFITLYKEKDNINIFDGQQRSVSIYIILCAILNKMRNLPDADLEFIDGVIENYIVKKNFRTKQIQYKLSFEKESTNVFFRDYIISGKEIPNDLLLNDQEKAIKTNYNEISNLIDKSFGKLNLSSTLTNLISAILDDVYLIVLETSSEDVANQMFETLNNTGKKIADFYVLKNQLVRLLGEKTMARDWDSIEDNLDGISKNKFLTAYVSVFNGKTSESNIFKAIEKSEKLVSISKAVNTLLELKLASERYSFLQSPRMRQSTDKVALKRFENLVETLAMASANQYKSVILAMELKNYKLSEINEVLSEVLKLHIKNMFISQESANSLEHFYPNLAKDIYNMKYELDGIINQIKGEMISNSLLKHKFVARTIRTDTEKKIIRYILRTIYNYENSNEVVIFENAQHVSLEHILPQNPDSNSNWINTFPSEETRNLYTHYIGNMTLLLGTKNSSAGNDDFDLKKLKYIQSNISQNKDIANNLLWDKQAIDSRNVKLFETFIKIW